jgi:hypothetical protein
MTDRDQIQREIENGILNMQRQIGIAPQESYSTLYHVGGYLMAASIFFCAVFIFAIKAKAQELRPGDLSPGPVWCGGVDKHLKAVRGNPMFRKPRAISGDEARYWSGEVFGYALPVDHAILIPQVDGGAILVPCLWGEKGPSFDGKQATRIQIDMQFKRGLEQPVSEQPIEEPKKKRTRRAEKK